MIRNKVIATGFLVYIALSVLCVPITTIQAADGPEALAPYKALSTIPGVTKAGETADPVKLITNIYGISIGIAAILAIGMIIWAGIQYATTEAISGKSEAKQHWQGALWGLLLLLSSYLILRTINLSLVEQDLSLGTARAGCDRPPCTQDEDRALEQTRRILDARKARETAALATVNESIISKEAELNQALSDGKTGPEIDRLEADLARLKTSATAAQNSLSKTTAYTSVASLASNGLSAFESAKGTGVGALEESATRYRTLANQTLLSMRSAKNPTGAPLFNAAEIEAARVEFAKQSVYMSSYIEWSRARAQSAAQNRGVISTTAPEPVRPSFNLITTTPNQ